MKRTFISLFLFINLITALANHPIVRNFTRDEYKSGTQNWEISQNESNTLYFANNFGLLEFDSKNWSIFPIKNRTNIRSVLCASNNRIYAGASNEFGYYTRTINGHMVYTSLSDKLSEKNKSFDEVWNIHQFEKTVYFQSDKSIFRYNGDTIICLPFNDKIEASAYIYNILFISSTRNGIFMLNGDLFIRINGSELLKDKKVVSILPLKGNKILFVTSFHGIYLYDGISIVPYLTSIDDFLKSNQVFCAAINRNKLVFGTVQRGIAILDLDNENVIYVNTFSGLQNNTVLSMFFDNQQNLWLGLDKGIDYVMLNTPILKIFGSNNLYGSGYASFRKDNILYFGTNQGLYSSPFPFSNNPLPIELKLVKGMEGQVWCLTEIDKTLFCGNDRGAFIVHKNGIEPIDGLQGTWSFKQLKHHPELILGCSYQGLFILKKCNNSWNFSHYIKGMFMESSPIFEEDSDGTIWFSHWQKGLFHLYLNSASDSITRVDLFNEKKGFTENLNNGLFKVGKEIVFSSEKGLYLYNKETDKLLPSPKWNSFFVSPPRHMKFHESKNGDIWCVSENFFGVLRKKPDTAFFMDSMNYRILKPKIILGFENFNFIDSTRLIISTEDGFTWIERQPDSLKKNNFQVFLRKIISNDEKKEPVWKQKTGDLYKHNQNSLRFEFAAPEYRNANLVRYSYILENYDETWSEFNTDNIKEYTQLPKGQYIFRIKAQNEFELEIAECSYIFTISPAWYETVLAILIYIFSFLLSIVGLIIWVNHRSKKGASEMEKRKELELNEQKKQYEADTVEKKREIKELKNQKLQYELRHKSQELASSTMNLIRKNEILLEIIDDLLKVSNDIKAQSDSNALLSKLSKMEKNIRQNIGNDNNWKRFEENFDLVYENYLKRLSETYPDLSVSDKKLCAYLKMDLSSKDIAPLINMSIRSVEMSRYRIRKKMGLDRDVNLGEFLQKF